jgi:hypothetical protein
VKLTRKQVRYALATITGSPRGALGDRGLWKHVEVVNATQSRATAGRSLITVTLDVPGTFGKAGKHFFYDEPDDRRARPGAGDRSVAS